MTRINSPELWRNLLPPLTEESHKYARGSAVIVGGGAVMTGAARLAALAALRAGSGLVTIAIPSEALAIYAASLLAVMVHPVKEAEAFAAYSADPRRTALLVGPGNGVTERTRLFTLAALSSRKPCVLDADALTVFADRPDALYPALHTEAVLTPHEGEFARLFTVKGDRVSRAQAAAQKSGAVIVLKGAHTVIAHPDGRTVINDNAPPWLATAGSGDVLAGIITGLLAQGMPAFEASAMGVWMHSQAANLLGRGMIAEDLPGKLPEVWALLPTFPQ